MAVAAARRRRGRAPVVESHIRPQLRARRTPRGYHVVNVGIHVAAALLVFGLVRRLLRRLGRSGAEDESTPTAFVVVAGWALHPLQTESVTYVSQRAEALAAFFILATLYAFVRSADSVRPAMWRVASVAACVLGVAVKEIVLVAPLLALGCDVLLFGSWRAWWHERRRYYLGFAGAWLLLAWLITRNDIERRGVGFSYGVPAFANVAVASHALVTYLRLACWPAALVFEYGSLEDVWPAVRAWEMAAMAGLIAGVVLAVWRRQQWAWALLVFGLLLAPTTGLVPVPSQPVSEHRMYLPLLPLVGAAVLALVRWAGARALVGCLVVALVGGGLTFFRNRDYRNAEALWRTSVVRAPENPRARDWLTSALAEQGKFDEALTVVREGLKLRPRAGTLHRDHGRLLRQRGELEQALLAATLAVALLPEDFDARTNLYELHGMRGDLPAALRHMEAAWRLKPASSVLASNLSNVKRQLGDHAEALRYAREAVRLAPEAAAAQGALAMALLETGELPEAIRAHAAWLGLQPAKAPPNHEFARALIERRAWPEAQAELEEMRRRFPNDTETRRLLGEVARRGGR